jgi:hypothetical protein
MIKLANSLIILLKFQLYKLHEPYTEVITTYDLGKIREDKRKFQLDFNEEPKKDPDVVHTGP